MDDVLPKITTSKLSLQIEMEEDGNARAEA